MSNPFDLRAALLAKHAQHVVLIHFPIALFLFGTGLDLAARFSKQRMNRAAMVAAARINIFAAAIFAVPVIVTGILAWQLQFAGEKLKGVLLLHLVFGCSAGALICIAAVVRRRQSQHEEAVSVSCLGLELVTTIVIALTAHMGGFLIGVNGTG